MRLCNSCGSAIRADAEFCQVCGVSVLTPVPAPETVWLPRLEQMEGRLATLETEPLSPSVPPALLQRLEKTETRMARLETKPLPALPVPSVVWQRIEQAEGRRHVGGALPALGADEYAANRLESKWPRTNLFSPKFWTRAWAVLGHNMAAVISVYAIAFIVFLVIAMLLALAGRR